jgi:hypothetical protein
MKMDESAFMKKVAGQLTPVVWQFSENGKWYTGFDTNNHRANTEEAGYPIRELCSVSEALAGYAVRDARIAELELSAKRIYSEMLEANNSFARMFQSGAVKITDERDQLRAELAAIKAGCGEHVAAVFTMGFGKHYVSGLGPKVDALEVGTKLYDAPAPAVVMPERREPSQDNPYLSDADIEWNLCLDEFVILNAKEVQE